MKKIFLCIVLYKMPLFILNICFVFFSSFTIASTEVSTFVQPFHFNAATGLVHTLRSSGVTTVSFPVVWAHVEKEQGKYDFSQYDKYFDELVQNGIKFIIILDSSGRLQFNYKTGLPSQARNISIPGWMNDLYPDLMSTDFSGKKVPEIDFYNNKSVKPLYSFYEKATNYFLSKYEDNISGFAIGIQSEFELKYGQSGYVWRNYSNIAKEKFSTWGVRKDMPIINYNNNIINGKASIEQGFASLMDFREFFLAKHICNLATIIHNNGGKANGYFGEVFTSHDAIYATGVIERLVSCLDAITIDYNFYNGYERVPNPWIPAMLSNYAKNLGYKKVYTGYYIERWLRRNGDVEVIENEILNVISKSLAILGEDGMSDGVEVGGFPISLSEISKIKALDFSLMNANKNTQTHKYNLGILAAKSNYYLWHGERSFERNIHSDALIGAYKLFLQDDRFKVYILGEETIINRSDIMSSLDAVFIPHQTTIAPYAENILLKYNLSGLKLIQDIRFSTFDPDGNYQGDWQSKLFGISIIDWKNKNETFTYKKGKFTIEKQPDLYASHAVLYPLKNYKIIAPSSTDTGGGLILRGKSTIALGFMPQLLEGNNSNRLKEITLNEIKLLIDTVD